MPRITSRSKQGQSNGSSKAPRALADVSSNALNRRNPNNDNSKPTKKRSGKTSIQSKHSGDTSSDAAIDELGRRIITRSMTLASEPENSLGSRSSSSTKHTTRRRARLTIPSDPSNMRVTRSMALRDKRLTASKIPIDAIANVATYLEPNDEAMNVCLAVGPKGARIVRRRYLLHEQCNHWCKSSTRFLYSALRKNMSKSRREQVVFQWMRYNEKWRSFMISKDYSFDAPVVKKEENLSEFCLVPMFANPGVAVSLELTFLVKTHFLRDDFDVNGFYSTRIMSEDSTNENSARIHLAFSAMLNDDVDTFDALAAHPSIDFGSISRHDDKYCFLIQSSMTVEGKNSPHFLRTIVNHRATDVNAPNLHAPPSFALTPLQWLLLGYGNTKTFESSPRWALEILLEAGADASLAPEVQVTPSEIALGLATMSATEGNNDKYNRYLEALTVMREWQASMKINGLVRGFLVRRRLATTHAAAQR